MIWRVKAEHRLERDPHKTELTWRIKNRDQPQTKKPEFNQPQPVLEIPRDSGTGEKSISTRLSAGPRGRKLGLWATVGSSQPQSERLKLSSVRAVHRCSPSTDKPHLGDLDGRSRSCTCTQLRKVAASLTPKEETPASWTLVTSKSIIWGVSGKTGEPAQDAEGWLRIQAAAVREIQQLCL